MAKKTTFKSEDGKVTIVVTYNEEWEEWIGTWCENGKLDEPKSIHANDYDDAVGTAKVSIERYDSQQRIDEKTKKLFKDITEKQQVFKSKDGRVILEVGEAATAPDKKENWFVQWFEDSECKVDKTKYADSYDEATSIAKTAIRLYDKGRMPYKLADKFKDIIESNTDRTLQIWAIKPYSSHPKDSCLFVVLIKWLRTDGDEWVVSLWNAESGSLNSSGYFQRDQFKEALARFNAQTHGTKDTLENTVKCNNCGMVGPISEFIIHPVKEFLDQKRCPKCHAPVTALLRIPVGSTTEDEEDKGLVAFQDDAIYIDGDGFERTWSVFKAKKEGSIAIQLFGFETERQTANAGKQIVEAIGGTFYGKIDPRKE